MSDIVEFLASFPPIQTAIKRSGDGGGMRIQLDIPESEMGNAVLLLACVEKRLKVRIEVSDDEHREDRAIGRRAAKKRISQSSTGMQ